MAAEQGSRACFASSDFTGRANLERVAQGPKELEFLKQIAEYAATMGRTISLVNGSATMCAYLLLSQARPPERMSEAHCLKSADTTHRACSVPRNISLYEQWLANS